MSELLFNREYQQLVEQSHPNLGVAFTETGLPYYLAPLPYFEVFKPGIFKDTYVKVAKKLPQLLNPHALIIGLPFEPYDQTAVLKRLPSLPHVREMAHAHKAALVIIANVDPLISEKHSFHQEFLTLRSLPNMVLQNFERSSSRHDHMKRCRRHFDMKGYQLIKNPKGSFALEFYAAYEKTHQKAKVPWLKYEKQYFQEVGALNNAHQIIATDQNGAFLGGITAFHQETEVHLARIAVNEHYHRKDGIFFMLLYEALHEAWSFGAKIIHLGPTSYELKSYLGSKPTKLVNLILPLTLPMRLLAPTAHFLLNHVLFRHIRHFEDLKRYF